MAINNRGILEEKLKCIGGSNDGEWHNIGNASRIGDHVRIPEYPTEYPTHQNLNQYQNIPTSATVSYEIYVISCFNFAKDDIYYFLIPESWTNKRAMLHQFNK